MPGVKIVLPEGAHGAGASEGTLGEALRLLTYAILEMTQEDDFYGMGGPGGYGANFENDTFLMHRFCWCEGEDCLWCGGSGCQVEHQHDEHRTGCYQDRLEALKRQLGEREEWDGREYWHVPFGSRNRDAYNAAKQSLCSELGCDYSLGNEVHCTCGGDAEWRARYAACQCDWHLGRGIYRFGPAKDAPHFWHKESGVQVRWYKWIGRDMEIVGGDEAAALREVRRAISSLSVSAHAVRERMRREAEEFNEQINAIFANTFVKEGTDDTQA
jgi:hypothetical protein